MYGRRCFYCQSRVSYLDLIVEHIEPKSRGGTNDIKNTVLACGSCNSSKCDQTIEEWLEKNILYRKDASRKYRYRNKIVKTLKRMIYGESTA